MFSERFIQCQEIKKEKEKKEIYPERGSFSVDSSIEKLKKIINGEIKPINLSEIERSEILSFENEMGAELEEIYKIKVRSTVIHPEYLQTNIGKSIFRSSAGFDVEKEDLDEIKKFIYRNRGQINNANGVYLNDLTARSKKYSEDQLIEKLSKTMTETGEINVEEISATPAISLVLDPEKALEKIQRLREFKKKLKTIEEESEGQEISAEYKEVFADVIGQYRQRVNELIVDQVSHVVKVKKMADAIGEESLAADEIELLNQYHGISNFASVYSRFDKFEFGVDGEVDEKGGYRQIGQRMESYAKEMEIKFIENERTKKDRAALKGLDLAKLNEEKVSKDSFAKYAEAFLAHYGQKSSEVAETFDPKRIGPASDGKWQFVPSFSYNSMDVNYKQRVIKAPAKDRSVAKLVSILLGHEFTHFIQGKNQSKVDLRLFNEVCGNRRLILTEGAAMSMQNQVSSELFGYEELPKPFYVKAMSRKLNGGSYLDCVKEYYESSMKVYLETTDQKSAESIKKEATRALGVAVRSCKRLFKSGDDLNSKDSLLSKSKDTVYIEQLVVMDKLREAGLEKFAMVRGLNLDSLFIALKDGFINADIESVDLDFIRNVWQGLKKDYMLDAEI